MTITKNKNVITITAKAGKTLSDNGSVQIPIIIDGKTFNRAFSWTKSKNGKNGKDGIPGVDSYFYIRYSANSDGSSMTIEPQSNTMYMGTCTTTSETAPTDYKAYKWALVRGTDGKDGAQGIQGNKGADGKTSYLHIKYSNDGTTFSPNNGEEVGLWIGTYVDFIEADSNTFSKYTWKRYVGQDGQDGTDGEDAYTVMLTNENHAFPTDSGGKITAEVSTTTKVIAYKGTTSITPTIGTLPTVNGLTLSKSGTTITIKASVGTSMAENGSIDIPITVDGKSFIKTFSYCKARQGANGANAKLVTVTGDQVFKYSNNFSGTPTPETIVLKAIVLNTTETGKWQYVETDGTWTDYTKSGNLVTSKTIDILYNSKIFGTSDAKSMRLRYYISDSLYDEITLVKISDGAKGTDGKNGIDGIPGKDGTSSYFYVRYSTNSNGNPMTTTPNTNTKYIGVCSTTSSTAPSSYSSYTWSKFIGEDGYVGRDGIDGTSSYLHIKYSNDGGKTFTSNNGEDLGSYIGTYVDNIQADSNNVKDYKWSKFVGTDGKNGIDGINGKDGVSTYFYVRYSANANGSNMTSTPSSSSLYIGVCSTTSATAPTSASSYQWTLIKGSDGKDGTPGAKGDNGQTSYLHIKYSNDGKTFTSNNGEDLGKWIGTYVDFNQADSTSFGSYTWQKYVGENGQDGTDGTDGTDAYTIILTNEAQTIPTTSSRVPLSASTYSTDIVVYQGITKRTDFTLGTINSANGITVAKPSSSKVNFTVSTGTALSADNGTFTIPITIDGKTFNKVFSWSCSKQGTSGVGIKSVAEHYAISSSNTTVPTSWSDSVPTMTTTNKYLWNYETITYTNNTTKDTEKRVIGAYGDKGATGNTGATGNGISKITNYYLASSSSSGVTTSTSGWTTDVQSVSSSKKYLWNYEVVTYTNGSTSTTTPCIIGTYGDKGDKGDTGATGADAYTVILTNENHTFNADSGGNIPSAITTSTKVIAYKGATSVKPTIGTLPSVGGLTLSKASDGVTINIQANTGTALATSGEFDIPITVDGKSFTKTFSWSKVNKGENAYNVSIASTSQVFKSMDAGQTYTPNTITLTPILQNLSYSKWQYSINGGSTWSNVSSGSHGLTLTDSDVVTTTYGEIVLSKTSSSITKGSTDTFTVKLNQQPTNNQTVSLSVNNSNASINKTSLTFTPSNYSTAQSVTITGSTVGTSTITLSSPNVSNKTISVTVNDTTTTTTYGNIVVSKTSSSITKGSTDTFTVKLDKAPTNNQTVTLSTSNSNATINKTSLTFTPSNYGTTQTVTITGASAGSTTITLSSPNVSNKTISVTVTGSSSGGSTLTIETASKGFNTDGSLDGNNSFTHTETYIPFSGNTDKIIQFGTTGWTRAIFYDSNKNIIGNRYDSGSAVTSLSMSELKSKSPNAVYVRVSINQTTTITLVTTNAASVSTLSLEDDSEYNVSTLSLEDDSVPVLYSDNEDSITPYASVTPKKLVISNTSDLFTDSVTSVVFKLVTDNASYYDTITVVKLKDVGEIELGGRNLLKDSKKLTNGWTNEGSFTVATTADTSYNKVTKLGSGATSNKWYKYTSPKIDVSNIGKQTSALIISFEMQVTNISNWDNQTPIRYNLYDSSKTQIGQQDIAISKCEKQPSLSNGKWSRIVYKRKDLADTGITYNSGKSASDVKYIGISFVLAKNGEVSFRKPKVEVGNIATDYSPAPEDSIDYTDELIDDLRNIDLQDIIELNNQAINKIDSIIQDGKITPNEKVDLQAEFARIKVLRDSTKEFYNTVNDTTLSTLLNDMETTYQNVKKLIDPVISNMTTTSNASASEIRRAFIAFYEINQSLLTALQQSVAILSVKNSTSIEALEEKVSITASKQTEYATKIDTVTSHLDFTQSGFVEIYATTNGTKGRFSTQITDQKLAFKDNGEEVAYISNQEMYITKATITDQMQIGNFIIKPSGTAKGGIMFIHIDNA